jgi:cytochrome d ubiquinol oxidase subunit I
MSQLLAARLDMAFSLGFHILFAAAGIAMPLFMVIAEWRWWRGDDDVDRELTRRWLRGTAILFAVGAVSGTVLSFELGLLWPNFMRWAGPVIGMPFSLEGFAFFLEAIFLGVYLYGWDRVPRGAHWFAGVVVAVSGCLSGLFVVCANAWMNTPAGFKMVNGKPVDIDPIAALLNPGAAHQAIHMTIAAYLAIAAAACGIHAWMLLKRPYDLLHRRAFAILFPVLVVTALLQPLSGDFSAKSVARHQPIKLAAMEGQWHTEQHAPLRIGGMPDERTQTTPMAIEIPGMLSFLAHGNMDAKVEGLDTAPAGDRPPVAITHMAFQVMVAAGMALLGLGLLGALMTLLGRDPRRNRMFLKAVVAASPLGLIALEAGWVVTEVGRQPWIVYGIMRTRDAVTPHPGLLVPLFTIALLYLFLGVVVVRLLARQVFGLSKELE